MSERLVIVADDLTGAADAAAAYGPSAEVAVTLEPATLPDAEVVAVDTDSRHLAPDRAAEAVAAAVRAADAPVYKKVDSTLRGNIGAEVAAALAHGRSRAALFAPAFPETGRTVIHGLLEVDGHAKHRAVKELFTDLRAELLPLETVRCGVSTVAGRCRELVARGTEVICADAATDGDLEILHGVTEILGTEVLPVGSAGLTRVAARARAPRPEPTLRPRTGSVLTVLGSYSALAGAQRAALAASGEVLMVTLAAPFDAAARDRAAAALAATTGDVLLVPDPTVPVDRTRAAGVAAGLAEVAGRFILRRKEDLAGLVLTGGETARAVLLAAGVTGFTVLGELEPGVVRSVVPALGGLPLVTKAGAFGVPETLDNARHALHESVVKQGK